MEAVRFVRSSLQCFSGKLMVAIQSMSHVISRIFNCHFMTIHSFRYLLIFNISGTWDEIPSVFIHLVSLNRQPYYLMLKRGQKCSKCVKFILKLQLNLDHSRVSAFYVCFVTDYHIVQRQIRRRGQQEMLPKNISYMSHTSTPSRTKIHGQSSSTRYVKFHPDRNF